MKPKLIQRRNIFDVIDGGNKPQPLLPLTICWLNFLVTIATGNDVAPPGNLADEKTVVSIDRQFWSFQPLRHHAPPSTLHIGWCNSPVDQFVVARLDKSGITPNQSSSRIALVRRSSFDLIGLPPTYNQIMAVVNDPAPDAYSRWIDRLLASPHYGERWGRHWLDVARFAESYGFEHDLDNKAAFHYRDFVTRALNVDLPYDRFVGWQIAGDELDPDNPLARMATGFLAAGVHNADFGEIQVEQERYDELDDIANTLGTAMLGLTIGCARCHDHKYDPIPQHDYYRFITNFAHTIRGEIELDVTPLQNGKKSKVLVAGEGLEPLARIYSPLPAFFEKVYLLDRGDPKRKRTEVTPSFLQVLMAPSKEAKDWRVSPPQGSQYSYRRATLVRWITDTRHGAGALLARVMANRIWYHHVGRGIVETPNEFGTRGARPTHPELLDWLASELVRGDWRLKPLHRLIVTSKVYMQTNKTDALRISADPKNDLFWHRPLRRLEAEVIRDAMLAVSHQLDRRMYGPGTLDPAQRRRSIYFTVKRSRLIPSLVLFDAPDALQGIGRRPSTTVAPQALLLMNSPLVQEYAYGFARSLKSLAEASLPDAIRLAFISALARHPTEVELADSLQFIRMQMDGAHGVEQQQPQAVDSPTPVLWLDASATDGNKDPDRGRTEEGQLRRWKDKRHPMVSENAVHETDIAPTYVPRATPLGQPAIRFGAQPDRLAIDNAGSFDFGTGDFTISILFRLDPATAENHHIVGKDSYSGSGPYAGYFIQWLHGSVRFATRNVSSDKQIENLLDSRSTFNKGIWQRITCVRKSGNLSIYVDDALRPDAVLAEREPTDISSPTKLKIGAMDDHVESNFHGDIAEILLYNQALTPPQIYQNHAYLRTKYLSKKTMGRLEMTLVDFAQSLMCLNEFIYVD